MLKPYVVVTNSDFTLLVIAEDAREALDIADQYYDYTYGDERDDWEVYDLLDFMGTDEVIEL